MTIGVALTPRLDISNEPRPGQGKTLTISYWWQNASAKVVEQNITSRIEAAVSAVKGVEKVSSVSQFGSGRGSLLMSSRGVRATPMTIRMHITRRMLKLCFIFYDTGDNTLTERRKD